MTILQRWRETVLNHIESHDGKWTVLDEIKSLESVWWDICKVTKLAQLRHDVIKPCKPVVNRVWRYNWQPEKRAELNSQRQHTEYLVYHNMQSYKYSSQVDKSTQHGTSLCAESMDKSCSYSLSLTPQDCWKTGTIALHRECILIIYSVERKTVCRQQYFRQFINDQNIYIYQKRGTT